ncbi:dihydropteroate synthase [Chitinophaga lutea]
MKSKNTLLDKQYTIRCRGKLVDLSTPAVMGIINVTDDSFFAASRTHGLHEITERAGALLAEGATFLDLGAQSTRPGAAEVGAEEELDRLIPAIHAILHHHPDALLSIDTYHAKVAEKCILAGAAIINDISAGDMDPAMLETAGGLHVPYIAMHMRGTPATMQQNPQYEDVTREVLDYFIQKKEACRKAGIDDVVIDPGFGFGKTLAHNHELMHRMELLHLVESPILVGVSRKSMVYRLLGNTPEAALNGTTVLHAISLLKGAHILRAHDVREAVECARIISYQRSF